MKKRRMKNILQAKINEDHALRKRYGIDPDIPVVVAPKPTAVQAVFGILRHIWGVIAFVGFWIGLVCLLSPNIRPAVMQEIITFKQDYLPFLPF